jgi:hypothetical protein
MKRATRITLVVVFFGFIVAGLVAHVCSICYPDYPYLAKIQQAFIASAEGGQESEAVVTAWASRGEQTLGQGKERAVGRFIRDNASLFVPVVLIVVGLAASAVIRCSAYLLCKVRYLFATTPERRAHTSFGKTLAQGTE